MPVGRPVAFLAQTSHTQTVWPLASVACGRYHVESAVDRRSTNVQPRASFNFVGYGYS